MDGKASYEKTRITILKIYSEMRYADVREDGE
jgi:hypothetical protein